MSTLFQCERYAVCVVIAYQRAPVAIYSCSNSLCKYSAHPTQNGELEGLTQLSVLALTCRRRIGSYYPCPQIYPEQIISLSLLVHLVRTPYGNSLIKLNVIIRKETVAMVGNRNHPYGPSTDLPISSSLDIFARLSLFPHQHTLQLRYTYDLNFSSLFFISASDSTICKGK